MALNLPPRTNDEELNRWLFELYSEAQANLYKVEVVVEDSDGGRHRIDVSTDGTLSTTEL